MSTDKLIHALALDAASVETPVRRSVAASLAVAFLLAAAVFVLLLPLRADFALATHQARFLTKFIFTGALGVAASLLVMRLARPGVSARLPALAAPLAIAATAVLFELAVTPSQAWRARMIGSNMSVCLTYVPLIGLAPLAALLALLRRAAPTRPALAGAAAGLAAGAFAAFFYGAHCTDDSPLFVVAWYSLAIGMLTLAGALAGARLLRW